MWSSSREEFKFGKSKPGKPFKVITKPVDEIDDYILDALLKAGVVFDVPEDLESPVKARNIYNIYERHTNAESKFAAELASFTHRILRGGTIALEQPIERKAYIDNQDYSGSGKSYAKILKNLCEKTIASNGTVVCMDQPPFQLPTHRKLKQYLKAIADRYEEIHGEAMPEEQLIDKWRNTCMVHYLYNYTNDKNIITINGKAHYEDLTHQLIIEDPLVQLTAIFVNVNKEVKPSIDAKDVEVNGKKVKQIMINTPKSETFFNDAEAVGYFKNLIIPQIKPKPSLPRQKQFLDGMLPVKDFPVRAKDEEFIPKKREGAVPMDESDEAALSVYRPFN